MNTSTLLLGESLHRKYGSRLSGWSRADPAAAGLDTTIIRSPSTNGRSASTGYQPAEDGGLEPQDNNFDLRPCRGDDLHAGRHVRMGCSKGQRGLLTRDTNRAASTANRWRAGPGVRHVRTGDRHAGRLGRTHQGGAGFTVLTRERPDSGATAVVAMNVQQGQARADPLLPQDRACAERGPAGIAALVQGSRT